MVNKIKTEKPRVSIVMPVYNCEKYLAEALASLLVQTYEDIEIVVINDGSTDSSKSILLRFAKLDPRIRIINQKNSGIVNALNRGIKESSGEYIARMDGDDTSFPNRIKEQVEILDANPESVLVAGNYEVMDEHSQTMYRERIAPDNEFIQRAFYLRNVVAHGSVMFRKSATKLVGDYSDKYGPTEDMELWMRMLDSGQFTATGTSIYRWRVNSQGITSQNNAESIKQAKLHIKQRWSRMHPAYFSRKNLINKTNSYLIDYKIDGEWHKRAFLSDTAQIAIKFITNGTIILGLRQLLTVASTGRTGLKIVIHRLWLVIKGRLSR